MSMKVAPEAAKALGFADVRQPTSAALSAKVAKACGGCGAPNPDFLPSCGQCGAPSRFVDYGVVAYGARNPLKRWVVNAWIVGKEFAQGRRSFLTRRQ
jgi:hypothetical protein